MIPLFPLRPGAVDICSRKQIKHRPRLGGDITCGARVGLSTVGNRRGEQGAMVVSLESLEGSN